MVKIDRSTAITSDSPKPVSSPSYLCSVGINQVCCFYLVLYIYIVMWWWPF